MFFRDTKFYQAKQENSVSIKSIFLRKSSFLDSDTFE